METLHMLSGGYIYQFPYDDIKTVFKNYYRATKKKGRFSQSLANSSPSKTTIKHEIGSMLEVFKSENFHTFAMKMDTMQIKRR